MPAAIALCNPVSDYLIHIDKMPHPNQSARLLSHSWQFGGNAATAIVTAAWQGVPAGLIGAVGDDPNGKAQRVDFIRHGVDVSHLYALPGMETNYTICISDDETHGRAFLSAQTRTRHILPEEVDMDYLLSAKYLLLDSNTPATRMAAGAMLNKGGEVMFDASVYTKEQEEMLSYSSIYITSEFYWKTRYGGSDIFECCRDMMKKGPHTVIFTLGDQGCAGIGPDGPFSLPAFPVENVVDTTGCGDTFHGAYIVGMERGLNAEGCAKWASASAAIKCTAIGGRAAQPKADIVKKFLETGVMDLSFIPERVSYYKKLHYE